MPEISRFYGIIISIFYDEHNPPHFHAPLDCICIMVGINSIYGTKLFNHLPNRGLIKSMVAQK